MQTKTQNCLLFLENDALIKDNYINEVLNETAEENPNKLTEVTVVGANDDWDDGLTFTAKSSRKY